MHLNLHGPQSLTNQPLNRTGSRICAPAPQRGRVVVVMPAFKAEHTLRKTVSDIPRHCVDEIILVDDCSTDNTLTVARSLGLTIVEHDPNYGYGGNQKTC